MTYEEMNRWARWWANRYRWATDTRADVDREDLIQAAMIGICRAQTCYDESGSWATWSSYFIRREIRALLGIRHGHIPPNMISLDVPVGEDGDERMIDLLADEDAPDAQDVAEYNDLQKQVRAAVARLKDDRQREVVERTFLKDESQSAVARDFGVSTQRVQMIWTAARKNLVRDKSLCTLANIELRTPYYRRIGVKRFQSTHTSDVENAVLWRERERQRLADKLRQCDEREAALSAELDRQREARNPG